MKRRLLAILVLSLIIGLSTSIGLAWLRATIDFGGAAFDHRVIEHTGWARGQYGEFWVVERRTTGGTARLLDRASGNGTEMSWPSNEPLGPHIPSWSMANGQVPEPFQDWYSFIVEKDFGWPKACLRVWWEVQDGETAYPGEGLHGGVMLAPTRWGMLPLMGSYTPDFTYIKIEDHHALPLRPVWSGLLINTLIFAGPWFVLALVLAIPGALLTRRHRRRGRCVRCHYPTPTTSSSTDAPCPECGTPADWKRPLVGRLAIGTLTAVAVLASTATIAFGVWRVVEVQGMPPVHLAAAQGDTPALKRSIAGQVPVDEPASEDVPISFAAYDLRLARPLAWAAARGHADAVRVLVDAGADPNADEDRALRVAANQGKAESCRVLLAAGADPNAKPSGSYSGPSVIVAAYRSKDLETIAVIREAIGSPVTEHEALLSALYGGYDVTKDALEHGQWTEEQLDSALWSATNAKLQEAIDAINHFRADPTAPKQPGAGDGGN